MKFVVDINEYVKVKLNDDGHAILKRERDELNAHIRERGGKGLPDYEPKVDKNGYTSFQFWVFMKTFGQYVDAGMESPFQHDITFSSDKY